MSRPIPLPDGVRYISLESLKNSEQGFGPTNTERSEGAPWIDKSQERADDLDNHWIYTTSLGLGPEGTPAMSDPTDPRRHRRGALYAEPPKDSEPPPTPTKFGR